MKRTLNVLSGVIFAFAVLMSCDTKKDTLVVDSTDNDTVRVVTDTVVVDTLIAPVDTVIVPKLD